MLHRAPARARDAPVHAGYARVTPGVRAGTVDVRVFPDGDGSIAEVTCDMTPLGPEDGLDPAIHEWEAAIAATHVNGG